MKQTKKILIIVMLLIFASTVCASTVDISVATNKSTYQLGEYLTISVTAYNPNPQPVTLNFSGHDATYIVDDTFDLATWPTLAGLSSQTIQPNASFTWNKPYEYPMMHDYPLGIGTHTVVGQLWAVELGENNKTLPVQFEVTPEPCTLALFGFALPFFRAISKRR